MNKTQAEQLVKYTISNLSVPFPFLEEWSFGFDHAKRRAGVCRPTEKNISLSLHHIHQNVDTVVKDTLLHELAHAIAFEVYGVTDHGPKWKKVARAIGATPKATGHFELPDYPWMLVCFCENTSSVEELAPRYRRNRNIKQYHLRGRPETKGRLAYVESSQLKDFAQSVITFEQLEFIQ